MLLLLMKMIKHAATAYVTPVYEDEAHGLDHEENLFKF